MKTYHLLVIAFVFFSFTRCTDTPQESAMANQPNIIFILTDDMGYGDLGVLFQNQRAAEGKPAHKTPHLDKLANEGMLLARHYVPAPVCAPSRASLLTGLHQGHANIRDNQFDKALEDNHTMATVLKEAGYNTALVGKYGLQGKEGNSPQTWDAYPTKRGFDFFFGYVRHRDGHNHYPAHEVRERPAVELYYGQDEISGYLRGCFTTDLFTAAAKKWIADVQKTEPDNPFFLYLAYDTPHAGLEVANAPYPEGGGIDGGVQWIGEENNFINTAGDTIDSYIHPDYAGQDWPMTQKRFASLIRRIDNGVGDLKQLLYDLDIAENTLIVFSSDNGPHKESYGYGDYDPTWFDSFGEMDGIKRDTWEGGIRVPAFAWWPGKISAGLRNNEPGQFQDWLPTFAETAGVPVPARVDGVSLLPRLLQNGDVPSNTVYVEYKVGGNTPEYQEFHSSHAGETRGQMQVVYLDNLKGVRYNINSHDDDFRIYNTENDIGETNNLAGTTDYYSGLQQRMKDEVIRLRRPDDSAPRPYDSIPVAAFTDLEVQPGLNYKVYHFDSPWVPSPYSLGPAVDKTGVSAGFVINDLEENPDNVIVYNGYLKVPETGKYTFTLNLNGKGIMRLHKALLFDADKNYTPGDELNAEIILEKGLHPVSLVCSGSTAPEVGLRWSGPGFESKAVDKGNLVHHF
ncbi:MAG: sulfatase-like hydrolase/transferase [Tangfeifania sp.]